VLTRHSCPGKSGDSMAGTWLNDVLKSEITNRIVRVQAINHLKTFLNVSLSTTTKENPLDIYTMETLVERTCKDCGQKLGPGREDKQYCDSACRTNYNNRKKRESQKDEAVQAGPQMSVPEYITRIQDAILKNRDLLESLCDEQKAGHIHMRRLIGRGFNTKFFTSQAEPTASGNVYRFCFEYGYCEAEDGLVIVICRKREIY
jgi:hypothetical protein